MLGRKLARSRGRSRPSRATHSRVVQARSLCDARGWRSGAASWPSSGPREFPVKRLTWRGERRGPHDRIAIAEKTRCSGRSSTDMAKACTEHVRAVRRRGEPRADDVASTDLPPRAGEQVLSERRVAIARCMNRGGEVRAARRVRELSAGRDSLALQRGSARQGRTLLQPATTILNARPVDEAADRTRLYGGCGGGITRRATCTGRGEIGAPRAAGAVSLSHDKERC